MGNVIRFPEKQKEEVFTPELVRSYTDTLKLAISVLDQLNKEDTDNCFWMVTQFNMILMSELERLYGELEKKN